MNFRLQFLLLLLSAILAGLLAGFFYTWSFTIMQSLNLISESNAATAMISINANIRNGWFGVIFFGTPISIFASLIMMLGAKNKRVYRWTSLALVFAIMTLVITVTKHLPLNDELANGSDWPSYFGSWVQWNHVRMTSSLMAFISILFALVLHFKLKSVKGNNCG